MPGTSYSGPLPPLTPTQQATAQTLRANVATLATQIGCRNVSHPDGLAQAESYLTSELHGAGYEVQRQTYDVDGVPCSNLWVEVRGSEHPDQIVLVGAHYDSVHDCPAANDNGSGVAATLALARALSGHPAPRTVRFVLFVNEEPPYFWTSRMGSLVYAADCKRRGEQITAMLSLETMGCYSDQPGSQHYPPPFSLMYPNRGDFIAFVGNLHSADLVRDCVGTFRQTTDFPCEGAALTMLVPRMGSSDHWSFWKQGYAAAMVTDTAPYRYAHYHKPTDTPEKIDYERLARVVEGLQKVVAHLATAPSGQ
jgi:hypothetical protein